MQKPVQISPQDSVDLQQAQRLRACLYVLAAFTWLITLLAGAGAIYHVQVRHIEPFRINAVFEILKTHLCAAIATTLALVCTREARSVSRWMPRAALTMLPLVLAGSIDRLALLTYPLSPTDPTAGMFVNHPRRTWTLKPNAQVPSQNVKLNARGMRGALIPFEKRAGEQRVVILGDSVAFGIGVSAEQCLDRRAAKRLAVKRIDNVTLVNLSVPGYSPWQHIDVLDHEGKDYRPDVVVYAFCMNDVVDWYWRDIPARHPSGHRFDFLAVSGLFRLARGIHQSLRLRKLEQTHERAHLALVPALQDEDTPDVVIAWKRLLGQVDELVAKARDLGARIAFVVFPVSGQVVADARELKNAQRRLLQYAAVQAIPALELLSIFRRYCESDEVNGNDLFIDGWHLSALGHQVAGEALADFLVDANLISAR